jgi:large subunit ribosomal protein L30
MAKVKVTQLKSVIDRTQRQKDTVKALGLRRINHSIEVELTPQIDGMIKKVAHLVKVENV